MNRVHIFNFVRDLLEDKGLPGRFTQEQVDQLDDAIDRALQETGEQLARESGRGEWVHLAAPLVEKWEGYAEELPDGSVRAYPDPATGGKPWTIGIGSTTDEKGRSIKPGTVWSRDRALKRFKMHLAEFGEGVDRLLEGAPTTPAQKAAMTSLAYNIGLEALRRSTLLRKHKAGDYEGAANEFKRWNRANGHVLRGLTSRRAEEARLYRI